MKTLEGSIIPRFDKNARLHNRLFVKQLQQIAVNEDHRMFTDGTVKFAHTPTFLERIIITLQNIKLFYELKCRV